MSLKELFEEMEKRYGINFIPTSKLNQGAVENLFGQLRSRGGLDDHPSPISLLYRLRLVVSVFKVAEVEPTINVIENELADESDFPPLSNPTASSSSMQADQVEEDGLNYLSGWLARKFNETYPEMGDYTYMLKREEHSYRKPSWVDELSYGGLLESSNELLKKIRILEMHFEKINKKRFFSKKFIFKRMFLNLKNVVDLPEEITQAFLRQRIFIRMKKLNQMVKFKELKKKGKTGATTKLRKIVD
ncbi:hypothetical protein JTB14_020641 [Gonioctena quinquepunctata]|nr:hypothetical protein JTB14_020641 [Gonioctena quinquepunctata]